MKTPSNIETLKKVIQSRQPVLLYFSGERCSVCKALKPKIETLISSRFKDLQAFEVTIENQPDIAAHFMVFTNPTVVVFFDGKESLRESKNMSITQFEKSLDRLYQFYKEA